MSKACYWMTSLLVLGILTVGLVPRFHHRHHYRGMMLRGTDSYRFYRQAEIIVENGRLPNVDTARWQPTGRNLQTHLNLSSYLLAGLYLGVHIVLPQTSLYDVACIYSIVCFLLSAVVLYLIAREIVCSRFAAYVLLFYMFFPPLMERSSFGFCDRDALCLFLILCGLYSILRSETSTYSARASWNLVAGISMGLLTLTWEGSGAFIALFTGILAIRLVNGGINTKEALAYLVFLLPIGALALLLTDAYQGNANFHTPIEFILWTPLLTFCLLIGILMIRNIAGRDSTLPHPVGKLGALFLSLVVALLLYGMLFDVPDPGMVYLNFVSPLGGSRLMKAVSELRDMSYGDFQDMFRYFFPIYIVGLLALAYSARPKADQFWILMFSLLLFVLILTVNSFHTVHMISAILIPSLSLIMYGLLLHWWPQMESGQQQKWLILLYSAVNLILARGAIRYLFFALPSIAIASAYLVWICCRWTGKSPVYGPLGLLVALLVQLAVIVPSTSIYVSIVLIFSLVTLAYQAATRRLALYTLVVIVSVLLVGAKNVGAGGGLRDYLDRVQPANESREAEMEAMNWIRANTPGDSVVYSLWDLGSLLNVIARRKTVIDEDHYRPYWIHLAYRHTLFAQTEYEALEFLKTRGVTHLLLTGRDLSRLHINSLIASDEKHDRELNIHHVATTIRAQPRELELSYPFATDSRLQQPLDVVVKNMEGNLSSLHDYVIYAQGIDSKKHQFRYIYINGRALKSVVSADAPVLPYSIICYIEPSSEKFTFEAFVVPDTGMHALFVQLYIQDGLGSRYFKKIYEVPGTSEHYHGYAIQIWEVLHPSDLSVRHGYSVSDFPKEATARAWYYGK